MFELSPQLIDAAAKIPNASQEHPSAAKQIAQRAADQNQGSQEQAIRLDDPLNTHDTLRGGLFAAPVELH